MSGLNDWLPPTTDSYFGVERAGLGRFGIALRGQWRPWIVRKLGSLMMRIGVWLNPWEAP